MSRLDPRMKRTFDMAVQDRNLAAGTKLWARYKGEVVHTADVVALTADVVAHADEQGNETLAYKLRDGREFKPLSSGGGYHGRGPDLHRLGVLEHRGAGGEGGQGAEGPAQQQRDRSAQARAEGSQPQAEGREHERDADRRQRPPAAGHRAAGRPVR